LIERFFPDEFYDSVFEIPYKNLLERGYESIIFDVDNTLAPYNVIRPPVKISALISRLAKMGFKMCLLSNNSGRRMAAFNENMKLFAVHRAMKPLTGGIKKSMELMGSGPENTVVIGDQLFTDILCGNMAGLYTVLVKPVSEKDQLTVRLKRGFEKKVLKAYGEAEKNKG